MDIGTSFLYNLRHNYKLPVRIVSPDFGHIGPEEAALYPVPQRTPYYLFLFMLEGRSSHTLDMQQLELGSNELMFVTPHQVHCRPVMEKDAGYIKFGFDDRCISLLPKHYPFLINPLNCSKVKFAPDAALRVKAVFAILRELLGNWNTEPELILAHLNSLLAEINTAYFAAEQQPANDRLSGYIAFKTFVDTHLLNHPGVAETAAKLGMNSNALYQIVKQYSGLSPKEYINNRLILEAKRRLYYTENISIKELAYELGFNDPEYFSRLFKRATGQTIAQYSADLSGF